MTRAALLLSLLFCAQGAFAQVPAKAAGGKVELYLEAMDGQAWQWFFLSDMVRRRLDGSELKVWPVVSKNDKGEITAKRGEVELDESRRIAVISRAWPARLLTYLNARSLNPAAEGWKDSALFAGLNPDELAKLCETDGKAALAAAADRAKAAGVTETALLLDGKPYEGSQRLLALYEAVNAALPPARRIAAPAGYKAPPKAPLPGFWVVTAPGIKKNDQLVSVFDRYFEGIKPVVLDHESADRKTNFPWLEFVPAYILSATPEAKKALEREVEAGLFKEVSGHLVYEDRQRRGFYPGRAEKPNTLQLFVMSQCPYGVLAENSVFDAEANKLLPEGLKIEVMYIGNAVKDDKGAWQFSSLHGEPEWQENARQLFIAKKFPDKYRAYLLERNKDYASKDWEKAAKAAGIDAAAVAAGEAEGKELLAENFKTANELGVSSSPSFLLNGREFMVGTGELSKTPGFEKLPPPGQPAAGCNSK